MWFDGFSRREPMRLEEEEEKKKKGKRYIGLPVAKREEGPSVGLNQPRLKI